MQIRLFSKGKFYLIGCPPGTRVVRCSEQSAPVDRDGHDLLVVPFDGQEICIPFDPSELLPLLAESRRCGLSLISGPEQEARLAGTGCTNCGEDDVNWLSVEDGSDTAHCDRCGSDFVLVDP